ncbi:hypothetical protein [Halocatena marina]|nr:hypothetical protein [Halocatena marina]
MLDIVSVGKVQKHDGIEDIFPAFTAQQRSLNDDSHLGRNSDGQRK